MQSRNLVTRVILCIRQLRLPVQELRLADGRVRFTSPEPERVLRELFARGAVLRDLEVVGVALEDAILALAAEP